jgi:DNA uptake protein ComE-like DNA-binding protein
MLLPDSITYDRKIKNPVLIAKETESVPSPRKTERSIASFDLNKADTSQLSQIKGIGPGLSRRIIKYRDLLGGFISENQIREVYGLDSTVVEELLKYGYIHSNAPLIKISVNTATLQDLTAHPYISPKVASIIVDYRKQHGSYSSLESLYNIRALNKATLDKLAPYLSFE